MCITALGLPVLCWNVLEDLEACQAEMKKCEHYIIIFTFWTMWVPVTAFPTCAIRLSCPGPAHCPSHSLLLPVAPSGPATPR